MKIPNHELGHKLSDVSYFFMKHRYGLAIILLSCICYFAFCGSRTPLDSHEVLVSQTAKEMQQSGNWIVPEFAGEIRLQKPPLSYWLTILLSFVTDSIDPYTARLPSAIASVITIALIYVFASKFFGRTVGSIAAFMQLSSLWMLMYGKMALIDASLVCLITASIVLAANDRLFDLNNSKYQKAYIWFTILGFWMLQVLIVLAKGPVGLAVVLPVAFLYRTLRTKTSNDYRWLRHPASWIGLFAFGMLSCLWPLAVYYQHSDALLIWQQQSIERYLVRYGPQTRPIYYYFGIVLLMSFPWTFAWIYYLILKARPSKWYRLRSSPLLLLTIWFVYGFIFFSCSSGKREHYILPALPPLSIFSALGMVELIRTIRALLAIQKNRKIQKIRPKYSQLLPRFVRWSVPLGIVSSAIASSLLIEHEIHFHPVGIVSFCLAVSFITYFGWETITRTSKSTFRRNSVGVLLSTTILLLSLDGAVIPTVRGLPASTELLTRVAKSMEPSDLVFQYGSTDRWTIDPINRPIQWTKNSEQLLDWIEASSKEQLKAKERFTSWILVPELKLDELLTLLEKIQANEQASISLHQTNTKRSLLELSDRRRYAVVELKFNQKSPKSGFEQNSYPETNDYQENINISTNTTSHFKTRIK